MSQHILQIKFMQSSISGLIGKYKLSDCLILIVDHCYVMIQCESTIFVNERRLSQEKERRSSLNNKYAEMKMPMS